MVILSVEICVGLKVLKNWGLHPVNEITTIAGSTVFKQFSEHQMEGCSSFVFPDELQEQPFECYIAPATSGPFQSSYSSAKIGEIVSFGKYLKFVITRKTPPQPLLHVVVGCSSHFTPFT